MRTIQWKSPFSRTVLSFCSTFALCFAAYSLNHCFEEAASMEGEACLSFADCADDLECITGTCGALRSRKDGESCYRNIHCTELSCLFRKDSSSLSEGDTCIANKGRWLDDEMNGLRCYKGICIELGNRKDGEACIVKGHCADDFRCVAGTCGGAIGMRRDGEACREGAHCFPNLICRDFTCKEQGENGETCKIDSHCSGNLICVANICVEFEATCLSNDDCSGSLLCSSSSRCVVCNSNDDCSESWTCNNDGRCVAPPDLCFDASEGECLPDYPYTCGNDTNCYSTLDICKASSSCD